MDTNAINSAATTTTATDQQTTAKSVDALTSSDFFELMITQLTNQDPLEPMSNQELLNQLSSIREMELSTSQTETLETLTDTLSKLTGQQRFSAAASLVGQYVTGQQGTDSDTGLALSGVVTAVRFDSNGSAVLQLDNGAELPLDDLASVMGTSEIASLYVGQYAVGVDNTDPNNPVAAEGIVTGASNESGVIMLELDTGERLPLSGVTQWGVNAYSDADAEADADADADA